ncbi:MAG: sporulation protein YqfD [Robinsoniella sp.]|nr:sporulation protein YqfD [Robinsoniella sp.]
MIDQMMRYGKGYVEIAIRSESYERFLNLCAYHQILIWDLNHTGEQYEGKIFVQDFRKIREVARKSGSKIIILQKKGWSFWVRKHRKRTGFFGGAAVCALLIFVLSLFIWDIQIEGNVSQTDEVILDYLKEEQITFGSLKYKIECKELAADLRRKFDQFIWVSVQMKGTLLKIQVQENTDVTLNEEIEKEPSSLVATKDGTVVAMITRSGKPMVSVGDTVKKGDILVLGRLEIKDDGGEVIAYQECAADADIVLETIEMYEEEFSMQYQKKIYTGNTTKKYYLQIGNRFFRMPWKGYGYETYDVVDQKRQLKLWGNFYLPISLGTYLVREYEIVEKTYTQEEATKKAEEDFIAFSEKFQEKGVQIFENDVKIVAGISVCGASGPLILREQAIKRVPLQETLDLQEGTRSE